MSLCHAVKKMEYSIISQVPGLHKLKVLQAYSILLVNQILEILEILQWKENAFFTNYVTLILY